MADDVRALAVVSVPHPSVYIQEEMDARGWSLADLANRMGPECCVRNLFVMEMYFVAGPTRTNCRLGDDVAERLGRAFGVSPSLFLNLERSWLDAQQRAPRNSP